MVEQLVRRVTPEVIKRGAQSMPSAPRVYARLQDLLERDDSTMDDVVDMVRLDSGLASGVLRLSNSPIFRRGSPVCSLDEAINRIGMREVNRIVGVTLAGQLFTSVLPLYGVDGEALWQNSLTTALAMSFLATASMENERQAYTLGLLRPVGRVILQKLALTTPGRFEPLPPQSTGAAATEWEQKQFGASNAEVTALLLAEWGFSVPLCTAVRQHMRPPVGAAYGRLAAILHVACWTAETLGKGLPGEIRAWNLDESVLGQAGLRESIAHDCVLETRTELNRLRAMVQQAPRP
ncbi:MAG TPA: HDOD domain-containing protein [Rariglobus sp.]